MKTAIPSLALLLLAAWVPACGSERDPGAPAGRADPPVPEQPTAKGDLGRPPLLESKKSGDPDPGDTAAGASFLAPGMGAPEDHQPIGAEDREVLSSVYISFAEDPEGFVGQVQQLAADRRQRIAGYLLCAANKLQAAGRPDQKGAPVRIELPIEAQELIRYEGSPDKARSMFLRQLGGEFLIIGRSIQSIHEGDTGTVEQILARQQQNLEMMKLASGPEQAAEWSATIRRVFPFLFARLIPEC